MGLGHGDLIFPGHSCALLIGLSPWPLPGDFHLHTIIGFLSFCLTFFLAYQSNMRGGKNIREMRNDRNKIRSALATKRKTDSAKWRDATLKSLTHTQERIRSLCEAFLAGEITSKEFERELPPILDSRDKEKRDMN